AALVPELWPLLPPPWRRRVSPATAAMIAGVALPVLRTLLPRRPPLRTVAALDIARWAGRWHAIACLPGSLGSRGTRDASVTYSLRGDHLAIERCWRRDDGTVDCTPGVGYRTEGGGGAKLEVSFAPRALRWLPWAWSAQWVVDIDPEYRHAVVGTPDRKRLWLLAREPHVDDATYQRRVEVAAANGFRVEGLRRLAQGER
ncbi:MAG TPA: lipocalin family protein, partial [Burkholderiaceae bacterium]|nr:lipocalin family protein [Burkholderiaceae bacterium]